MRAAVLAAVLLASGSGLRKRAKSFASSEASSGCCTWGGGCGGCGEDGTGWCHQSASNCQTCSGTFAPGAFPPACGQPTPSPTPPPVTPAPSPPAPTPPGSYPLDTPLFIRSHRGENLQDDNGNVHLTSNAESWEKWLIIDDGDGKVVLRSHRAQYLQDNAGQVKMSPNTQDWEEWTISSAGDGKFTIMGHRGEYLQDNNGQVRMSADPGSSEAWSFVEPPPPPTPGPFPEDAFTLVVIPDVQFMTMGGDWASWPPRYATPERWYAQGNWVAANKDTLKIEAVIQVGDLVETGCEHAHWTVFNRGWEPIHNTGLPYSFAAGNHDCDDRNYGCNPRGWNCFNSEVPHFLDRVSFPVDFISPGQYQNMITLFEAAGLEFIIVAVEWNTPPDALAWARSKVQQYSDRWAIFNVHYEPAAPGYLDLAKSHNKTFMVTQGHHCIYGEEEHRFHQGAGAQPFIELLVDYQCNENGFLKHFTIDKTVGRVQAHTYNPYTGASRYGGNYDFSWNFEFV